VGRYVLGLIWIIRIILQIRIGVLVRVDEA